MRKVDQPIFGLLTASIFVFVSPVTAQVNCETIPVGPARTDCYIGQARMGAGNAAIADTKAKLETDQSILSQATGQRGRKKPKRKKPAQ